jgi:hypothetical protein
VARIKSISLRLSVSAVNAIDVFTVFTVTLVVSGLSFVGDNDA